MYLHRLGFLLLISPINLLVSRCGSIIYNRYNAQDLRTLRSTAESWAEEEDTVAAMENLLRTLKEMSEAE
jgi:hypothetical protein